MPRPIPAPIRPVMARPAPMCLATLMSIWRSSLISKTWSVAVTEVHDFVEVDARERGEHEGLHEGDHQLEQEKRHHHEQRQRRAGVEHVRDAAVARRE